jgi:hypothetical protein
MMRAPPAVSSAVWAHPWWRLGPRCCAPFRPERAAAWQTRALPHLLTRGTPVAVDAARNGTRPPTVPLATLRNHSSLVEMDSTEHMAHGVQLLVLSLLDHPLGAHNPEPRPQHGSARVLVVIVSSLGSSTADISWLVRDENLPWMGYGSLEPGAAEARPCVEAARSVTVALATTHQPVRAWGTGGAAYGRGSTA